jgi:selenocysteine-specific elongation factor
MFVLGTAGHVDHGKSVLVHALTGIDPDRLREEKERGMTIDLGFAWLELPSGREVSIVDVPGHERFIKNMLAGVGGIDLALLTVAADEGIMPQTREHLAILDLLGVERGIIVITKKDLVDEELLQMVQLEVKEEMKGTTLASAPILAVSAFTGEGLSDLLATIDHLLGSTAPRKDLGRPRLPIDRAFTMKGFGTVVTGTLIDGQLSTGQEVEILPPGLKARIRGLQTHKKKIDIASPGTRVAANLINVSTDALERGYVLTNPGWLTSTRLINVKLKLLPYTPRPLLHNATVTFHTGAEEVTGKVRLLEKKKLEPGESAWAQIELGHPVAVVRKDGFIIRSSNETVGGGEIIDPRAKRHRRLTPGLREVLAARESDNAQEVILATLKSEGILELEKLSAFCNLSQHEVKTAVEALTKPPPEILILGKGSGSLVISQEAWQDRVEKAKQLVQSYHREFPLRHGMPKEELRNELNMPPQATAFLLKCLSEEGILLEEKLAVRLPEHQLQLNSEQQAMAEKFIKSLEQNPYSPPAVASRSSEPFASYHSEGAERPKELTQGKLREEAAKQSPDTELLNFLIEQGKVVRVSDDIVFTASAYNEMVMRITNHIKSHGKITVAEVRDLFKTSRKYALALMEYLDGQKITRRVGDERVLR